MSKPAVSRNNAPLPSPRVSEEEPEEEERVVVCSSADEPDEDFREYHTTGPDFW